MLGQRANLAVATLTASAGGSTATFAVNRDYVVHRIKFNNDVSIIDLAHKFKFEAEGEVLYSGVALALQELCHNYSVGGDAATAEMAGPWVLEFDRPILLTKDYPLKVTQIGLGSNADVYTIVIEGA